MDGTLAPLPQLCDIAEKFDSTVIVDEAHGTGVFGADGRGVCERQNVQHRIAVKIGTLSKAIGGLGGFVAGSETLCEWLWNNSRSQFFSTAAAGGHSGGRRIPACHRRRTRATLTTGRGGNFCPADITGMWADGAF